MKTLLQKVESADWETITAELHHKGYAIVPDLLSNEHCEILIHDYTKPALYRKTVIMERHRFGLGEYKYFCYPLPDLIDALRERIYEKLVPIANVWFRVLKVDVEFPSKHRDFREQCHKAGQDKAAVLILKYGKGGFNALHQDLYGEVYFPIQVVFMLNDPEMDFTGGEFVLTQQVPRAQSRPIVLKPAKGDAVIFTTSFKPEKGSKGHYRVSMKHGVSEVESGERHTLGIIFHDAMS